MDRQEMFDLVAVKILGQRGPSMDSSRTSCMYRGEEGRRCAAGWLISDDAYNGTIEGDLVHNDVPDPLRTVLKRSHIRVGDFDFVSELQDAHDAPAKDAPVGAFIRKWKARMRLVAENNKLNTKALDTKVALS